MEELHGFFVRIVAIDALGSPHKMSDYSTRT